jgi:hypothetical protein
LPQVLGIDVCRVFLREAVDEEGRGSVAKSDDGSKSSRFPSTLPGYTLLEYSRAKIGIN